MWVFPVTGEVLRLSHQQPLQRLVLTWPPYPLVDNKSCRGLVLSFPDNILCQQRLGSSICKNALVLSGSGYISCTKVELSLPWILVLYNTAAKVEVPYERKFWRGKKLMNLANRMPFTTALHPYYSLYNQLYLYTQLIHQYFTLQLVRISQFANISPNNIFPHKVSADAFLLD